MPSCSSACESRARSKSPETVKSDSARHMGSTVWVGLWVKGGREREQQGGRGRERGDQAHTVVAGGGVGICSLPEVGGVGARPGESTSCPSICLPCMFRRPDHRRTCFDVWVLGLRVHGLGFRVWGVGCGVWGVGCGMWGVGCGVWGVGCGVWG